MKTKILAILMVMCLGLMSIPFIDNAEGGVFTYEMEMKSNYWNFKSYPNQTITYSPVLFSEIPYCVALSGKNPTTGYWYTYWPTYGIIENWTINPGDGLFVLTSQNTDWNITVQMGYTRGDLWVDGNFSVAGDSSLDYNVTVNGSMTVSGNFEVNRLTVTNDLNVSGNLTVIENLTVGGNLSVTDNLNVGGDFEVSGSVTVTGDLTVTGDILGATGRGATIVIASATTSALGKAQADYVCDGTDDDVEIQSAIDALPNKGGRIILSDNNFNITTQINLSSDTIIEGQGPSTILTQAGDNSVISINTTSNIQVINIKFDSDQTHDNALMNINDASNIKIYNCHFRECLNAGISIYDVTSKGVISLYIEECYFYKCGNTTNTIPALKIISDDSTNIHIHKCIFEPSHYRDIEITSTDKISGVWITENWFEGQNISGVTYPTSTHVYASFTYDYTLTIEDNYFYDPEKATCSAMRVYQVWGLTIKDNVLMGSSGNTADYAIKVASSRGLIEGNYVWYVDVDREMEISSCDELRIANNFLMGANLNGDLWLTSCTQCIVVGNQIIGDNGELFGIRIESNCDNISIIGNSIKDLPNTGDKAIGVTDGKGHDVIIIGNIFENCGTPVNGGSIVKDNIGYIAPGEIRTASGSLTAGVANAICFAWHNPEAQDIFIRKVVIEVTTAGGTANSLLDVGIADDATGTNRGTEFFDDLGLNTVSINDSWVSADGGTQVKWVFCQDSASGTDGWVVGQILDQNASSLVGKYYIEYCGR